MSIRSMSRYSYIFLNLAKYHEKQLSLSTNYDSQKNLEHTFGTIIFSVTYLENYVNEIISDLTQDAGEYIKAKKDPNILVKNSPGESMLAMRYNIDNFNKNAIDDFLHFYSIPKELDIEKWSIIEKYELLLHFFSNIEIDRGDSTYGNVSTLIKLRNFIIHHKPKFYETKPEDYKKYEKKGVKISSTCGIVDDENLFKSIRGKFDKNPNEKSEPNSFFGLPCAIWAIKSVENYLKDFKNKVCLKAFNT